MHRRLEMVAGFAAAQDFFGLKTEQRLVKDEVVFHGQRDPNAAILEAARLLEMHRPERRAQQEKDFADDGRLLPAL